MRHELLKQSLYSSHDITSTWHFPGRHEYLTKKGAVADLIATICSCGACMPLVTNNPIHAHNLTLRQHTHSDPRP